MRWFGYRYRLTHAIAENVIAMLPKLIPREREQVRAVKPERILVLKFGGMGEAVLARSLLDALLERNPTLIIDYLVERRTLEAMTLGRTGSRIFHYSPSADGLRTACRVLRDVRQNCYDAVVDFEQHSLLTAFFCRATSAPLRVGFIPSVSNDRDRLLTHAVPLNESDSMWSAFVRLGRVLDPGLPEMLTTTPLPTSPEAERWMDEWWTANVGGKAEHPVVAMHLGVGPSAQYRRWPLSRFSQCAAALRVRYSGLTILLTGAAAEREMMGEFRQSFPGKSVEAADLGTLERTCALLRRCDLLLSADTGIMHLAAAMGTPTVGLFGPNTPRCWAPVGRHATWVCTTGQSCSPCINSYRRSIPERCTAVQEGACMWDIGVQDVLRAVDRVIGNGAPYRS
ncbi:MAG: glycosyltransferase family 9 protein [Acidobacteriota bacterium]